MINIDMTSPLTEEQLQDTINSIAKQIVARRLEVPAVIMLETHKPLSYIASQGLIVGMPLLGPLVGHQRMADFSKILAKTENIERLIQRIEDMAGERDETEAAQKTAANSDNE